MTPPATASARRSPVAQESALAADAAVGAPVRRRPKDPPAPRRVSGPARTAARGARAAGPAVAPAPSPALPRLPRARPARPARSVNAPGGLGARLLARASHVPDARLLDRLIRGRFWIGFVAFALIGIVAMQLSLLKLNTGIGRALAHQALLQRQNAALETEVSSLSATDRVERMASALGMTLTAPGSVHFLLSHSAADAQRAAAALSAPASSSAGLTPTAAPAGGAGAGTTTAGSAPPVGATASAGAGSTTSTGATTPLGATAAQGITPPTGG